MESREFKELARKNSRPADSNEASGAPETISYNICVLIDNDKLLLKFANRGISKGKWNFPGGHVEEGETLEESVIREIREETGLVLEQESLFYHGKIDKTINSDNTLHRIHVFSSRSFTGRIRDSEEGALMWFDKKSLPEGEMWKDAKLWIDHIYKSRKFDVDIAQDNYDDSTVKSSHVRVNVPIAEKKKKIRN